MLDGLVSKELRHQVQLAIAEPQSIEHQGYGGRADAHLLPAAGILLVESGGHPDLATDLGDDA